MFIDKLHMLIALQENRKIIKPCDNALQLDTVYEKHRNSGMGLTNIIQENLLQIAALFTGHLIIPLKEKQSLTVKMKINNASSPAFSAAVTAGHLKSNERGF
jgi:hypothetical protein